MKIETEIIKLREIKSCTLEEYDQNKTKWTIDAVASYGEVEFTAECIPYLVLKRGYVGISDKISTFANIRNRRVLVNPEIVAVFAATHFFQSNRKYRNILHGITFRPFCDMKVGDRLPIPDRDTALFILDEIEEMSGERIPRYDHRVFNFVGEHSLSDDYAPFDSRFATGMPLKKEKKGGVEAKKTEEDIKKESMPEQKEPAPKPESVIVREVCGIYNAIMQNAKARKVALYTSIVLGVLILFWGYRCYRQHAMEEEAAVLDSMSTYNPDYSNRRENFVDKYFNGDYDRANLEVQRARNRRLRFIRQE